MAQDNHVILCVDDEPNSLVLRKLVLERAGYKVITASSVQQAMKVLESEKPDLVLSDQLMPGGTGTELAKQVKEKMPRMPVIIISGVNEIPPDATYADLFMSKVEGPIAMCEKVASVLNRDSQ
ncbi:MAG TPA: response regulator [Candidatus Limnocylindrales bacterium]|nr:response regulator [Candidatus Limnocylindrales bacterium]